VAKEAADIVLLDDNFGSIVAAIEEGRTIYRTIKKVILYLFSTSLGEVLTIIGAIMLGYDIPITASQIIWLNFVTDGFLVVALALEPGENSSDISLSRKQTQLVDWMMFFRMLIVAIVMTVVTLFLFRFFHMISYLKASTIALTALAVMQWFNVWNCRSEKASAFSGRPYRSVFLIAATVIVIFFQILAVYTPFLQRVLRTTPLTLVEWTWIVGLSAIIIFAEEIRKFFARRKS
jgi:Ca2+-transporting ATPase